MDIAVTTHGHLDHHDAKFLTQAVKNGAYTFFPDDCSVAEKLKDKGLNQENIIELKSGESKKINPDIKVTAFQTDHRGDNDFRLPVAWFLVEVDGFKLLHTGDGIKFRYSEDQNMLRQKDIDIIFANIQTHVFDIRDYSPKVVIPLHMNEFMHPNHFIIDNGYLDALENYQPHADIFEEISPLFLLWGESFVYPQTL